MRRTAHTQVIARFAAGSEPLPLVPLEAVGEVEGQAAVSHVDWPQLASLYFGWPPARSPRTSARSMARKVSEDTISRTSTATTGAASDEGEPPGLMRSRSSHLRTGALTPEIQGRRATNPASGWGSAAAGGKRGPSAAAGVDRYRRG